MEIFYNLIFIKNIFVKPTNNIMRHEDSMRQDAFNWDELIIVLSYSYGLYVRGYPYFEEFVLPIYIEQTIYGATYTGK